MEGCGHDRSTSPFWIFLHRADSKDTKIILKPENLQYSGLAWKQKDNHIINICPICFGDKTLNLLYYRRNALIHV